MRNDQKNHITIDWWIVCIKERYLLNIMPFFNHFWVACFSNGSEAMRLAIAEIHSNSWLVLKPTPVFSSISLMWINFQTVKSHNCWGNTIRPVLASITFEKQVGGMLPCGSIPGERMTPLSERKNLIPNENALGSPLAKCIWFRFMRERPCCWIVFHAAK